MIAERCHQCASARPSRNIQTVAGPPAVRMLLSRTKACEVLGRATTRGNPYRTIRGYPFSISRGLPSKLSRQRRLPVAHGALARQAAIPVDDVDFPRQPRLRARSASLPRPPALPPPPKSGNLLDVLPYLVRLAVADRQLWWRLGIAVLLMLASKAAGGMACRNPILSSNDLQRGGVSYRCAVAT